MIDDKEFINLLRKKCIPTDGWYTASISENPVQIWDRANCGGRYTAIINRNDHGRIRVFDKKYSRLIPIADTGWDPITAEIRSRGSLAVMDITCGKVSLGSWMQCLCLTRDDMTL